MKTKRAEPAYKIDPFLDVILASIKFPIEAAAGLTLLQRTSRAELVDAKASFMEPVLGRPSFYCASPATSIIEFFPVPDQEYEIVIRYLPPMREQ